MLTYLYINRVINSEWFVVNISFKRARDHLQGGTLKLSS